MAHAAEDDRLPAMRELAEASGHAAVVGAEEGERGGRRGRHRAPGRGARQVPVERRDRRATGRDRGDGVEGLQPSGCRSEPRRPAPPEVARERPAGHREEGGAQRRGGEGRHVVDAREEGGDAAEKGRGGEGAEPFEDLPERRNREGDDGVGIPLGGDELGEDPAPVMADEEGAARGELVEEGRDVVRGRGDGRRGSGEAGCGLGLEAGEGRGEDAIGDPCRDERPSERAEARGRVGEAVEEHGDARTGRMKDRDRRPAEGAVDLHRGRVRVHHIPPGPVAPGAGRARCAARIRAFPFRADCVPQAAPQHEAVSMRRQGILALSDGTIFEGEAIGAAGLAVGEVVFNTAMTGYQEILTDPSYHQQIVTLTTAHVGNTGVNPLDVESPAPQVAGFITRDVPRLASNWRATEELGPWLERHGVVALAGVSTRRLTHLLRDKGAQHGAILVPAEGVAPDREAAVAAARAFAGLDGADLARVVTRAASETWAEGRAPWSGEMSPTSAPAGAPHVVAYDFGIKREILRLLVDRGLRVTVVPAETSAEAVLALAPDGIFLSNGPGDPAPVTYAQAAIRTFAETDLPIFGICLGHQLLCLALGARSLKMKFGHHGANHPVRELGTASPRVFITSQNHGFAIDADALPPTLRATHVSLFDGSLQGVAHVDKPIFSFQGHPEASPGPRDIEGLFDRFADAIRARLSTARPVPASS